MMVHSVTESILSLIEGRDMLWIVKNDHQTLKTANQILKTAKLFCTPLRMMHPRQPARS
jgi:hypothetical protein